MITRYRKHSKRKIHTCVRCSYKTTSIISIEQHIKFHKLEYIQELFSCIRSPLEPYTCQTCHYKTYFVIDWKKHNELNHQTDVKIKTEHRLEEIETKDSKPKEVSEVFYCTNCGFQTYSQLVLLRHVYAKCPIKVGIKTYVEIEENTYIEVEKPEVKETPPSASVDSKCFTCDQCSYRTESNLFFIMHLTAEHTNPPQERHEFTPKPTLEQFKAKKDFEETKYRCNKCTYQSKWKSGLKVHMISRHPKDNIKWYKCKQCSYMTKWKHNLQTHKITKHTKLEDIKWFECEQCPYKAKVGSCLRNHFLSKHTAFRDLKWLHCDKCSHKTRWKSNLKAHVRAKHPIADRETEMT